MSRPTRLRAHFDHDKNNFDALRLLFAAMVVVHHTGILSRAPVLAWATHISAPFAVQAFFVVSGFLVTMSCEKSSSLKSYALKRVRRIAPAYLVVVTSAALMLSVLSTLPFGKYFADGALWRYIFSNLALANFAAPDLPGVFQKNFISAVNGSLWTIKIEVAFYCCVPAIVWAGRRFGFKPVLALMFATSVAWKLGFDAAGVITGRKLFLELAKQIPGQLCFFAGGVYAYYRTRQGMKFSQTLLTFVALLSVALYAMLDGWFMDIVGPLAVTAIVFWAAFVAPLVPNVGKHGDFSYGTYLYHFPIIQSAIALGVFAISPVLGLLSVVATVAVCAALSWYLVEQPSLRRRRVAAVKNLAGLPNA